MRNLKPPRIVPGQFSNIELGPPKKPEFKTLRTAMRLALGTAMIGVDEVSRRLNEQQEHHSSQVSQKTEAGDGANGDTLTNGIVVRSTVISPDETEADRLRYALIGMMTQTPDVVAEGISTASRMSGKATRFFGRIVSPVANSRVMRPVRDRYDTMAAKGESMVDRWIEIGRAEEQAGRIMAQDVANKTVDELVDYLGQKPEIRELIQQQSVGMFDEVLDAVQFRAAGADTKIERVVRKMLRLPDRELFNTTVQIPADTDSKGK